MFSARAGVLNGVQAFMRVLEGPYNVRVFVKPCSAAGVRQLLQSLFADSVFVSHFPGHWTVPSSSCPSSRSKQKFIFIHLSLPIFLSAPNLLASCCLFWRHTRIDVGTSSTQSFLKTPFFNPNPSHTYAGPGRACKS